KVVFVTSSAVARAAHRLTGMAEVVDAGEPIDLRLVLDELHTRGIRRLMVEGGGNVFTQFLAADLVDELQVVVAPFLIGSHRAPRFVHPARFPQGPRDPFRLAE